VNRESRSCTVVVVIAETAGHKKTPGSETLSWPKWRAWQSADPQRAPRNRGEQRRGGFRQSCGLRERPPPKPPHVSAAEAPTWPPPKPPIWPPPKPPMCRRRSRQRVHPKPPPCPPRKPPTTVSTSTPARATSSGGQSAGERGMAVAKTIMVLRNIWSSFGADRASMKT